MYSGGEEISIKVNNPSNDIDYENSTLVLKNESTGNTTELSFTDDNVMTVEEGVSYTVTATLKDENGNENVLTYKFTGLGEFTDSDIAANVMWDFDEAGYINNIILTDKSDELTYELTDDVPSSTGEITPSGGALKLELKAGEEYDIILQKGQGERVEHINTVGFTIYTTEVVDIFELYNTDDMTMVDMSWKAYKRNQWQNVECSPNGAFLFDYNLDNFGLRFSVEEDTTVYIDKIYYTDPVQLWDDTDRAETDIALFDDANYMQRISGASATDHTTFGGSYSYVTEIDGTTDFDGALKFASTTDPASTSDGKARDGFTWTFFERMSMADFKDGICFRIYATDPITRLTVSFTDLKLGETAPMWITTPSATNQWVDVVVTKSDLSAYIDGFEMITTMCVRVLREQHQANHEHITYIDKITVIDYAAADYNFSSTNDIDAMVVSGRASGNAVGVVADSTASDGYAYKGVSALYKGEDSGINISFPNIDVTQYTSINVYVRVVGAVGLSINNVYAKWVSNTSYQAYDIIALMGEVDGLKDAKTLSMISFGRELFAGQEIYVDKIVFISKADLQSIDYNFSSETDNDAQMVNGYGAMAVVNGIVAVDGATDGYAMKVTRPENAYGTGLQITFDSIDLSKYSSVVVRIKAVTTGESAVYLYLNNTNTYIANSGINEWKEVDVLLGEYVTGTEIMTAIIIKADWAYGHELYIDSITFTEKTDEEVGGDDNTGDDTQTTYVDPSFGTKKDDTYTYISDFNDSGVTQLVENAYINAWGTSNESITMTVGQGAVANGTGLTLQGEANNVSVEFNLTSDFDLTNVDKLIIDFNYSDWHGGALYNYVFITIGSTRVNVMPYATFYYGDDLATASEKTSSNGATDYFQYNNMYGFIVIDVQAMLANADFVSAFGSGKAIDGFVFGYNGGNGEKSYCVDAVYYSTLAE